jgi:DNA (cytosine-5)-methyltransferase 1
MSKARQIGNAFPPLAAKFLAEHIAHLDGAYGGQASPNLGDRPGALLGYHLTDASGMSPALASTEALLECLRAEQQMSMF